MIRLMLSEYLDDPSRYSLNDRERLVRVELPDGRRLIYEEEKEERARRSATKLDPTFSSRNLDLWFGSNPNGPVS